MQAAGNKATVVHSGPDSNQAFLKRVERASGSAVLFMDFFGSRFIMFYILPSISIRLVSFTCINCKVGN